MSFSAETTERSHAADIDVTPAVSTRRGPRAVHALGRPYEEPRDWGQIGSFAAGIAIGAVIGAGVALLVAPASGEDVRAGLWRGVRGMGTRATTAWDDLGDELHVAARRGRRHLSRGITRGGWAAEDLVDKVKTQV